MGSRHGLRRCRNILVPHGPGVRDLAPQGDTLAFAKENQRETSLRAPDVTSIWSTLHGRLMSAKLSPSADLRHFIKHNRDIVSSRARTLPKL